MRGGAAAEDALGQDRVAAKNKPNTKNSPDQ